ncbi:polycomb group protein Psc [Bactrocera neohumeralis]|uniref:polycomb group protein Psc n=1 Tax=Bactrocera neohumeralis TaxID=98809 RepID=UPI002165CBD9|nr:polycomb group protein Psc [Bactrocera neohumeralis]
MSPVPGATSVVGTGLAPPPASPASTFVTTTTTTSATVTSTSPSRVPMVSSQQQQHSTPSRTAQCHTATGGSTDNKSKHHFNNNNNIKNNNCNNNVVEQNSSKSKNNKLSVQHNGGLNSASMESVRQMKQHQQQQHKQQQQQQQQQTNKHTNSDTKAKSNDMQKHTNTNTNTTTKLSFTHATSTTNATVNGATAKSVNNAQFSSPVGNVVGTSTPSSSASPSALSPAQTNCSTKSPTTTTTTKATTMPQPTSSATATAASSTSSTAKPLALSAVTSNAATSTPEAAPAVSSSEVAAATGTINAKTIIKSAINQNGVEIKEESDPQQVIVKVEETTANTKATTAKITTTTVNQVATPPTLVTNQKDTTAATAIAAPAEANKKKADPLVTTDDASADNLIVDKPRKVLLSVMNPHIICHLCTGYLIDATTIVECLHSFCHSCLIKHLRTEQYCPRCEMMINTAKPNIKPDTTLQAIVYKLVPGLYERELMRKRAFYKDRPAEAAIATPEQRGEDTEHLIFSPSDCMSLSLEFADTDELVRQNSDYGELLKPRYLQCPAMCTVGHLKKFVYGKFDIDTQRFNIDIMYKVKTIVLLDHYTLMDVAYIYTWKRDAPMRFYFRVKRSLRPIVKARKPAAIMPAAAAPEPVEIKDEVVDAAIAVKSPKIPANETPQTTISPIPDAMTIIPKPVASALKTNDQLIMTPEHIKEEEVEEAEELKAKPIVEAIVKPAKPAKVTKAAAVSSSTEGKRSHSNSSAERKAEKALNAHNSHNSPKSSKEKREAKEALKQAAEQPRDERKVENIKLKIDLSKHNSVTIINMSDPQRREITKPVRPEKEWKQKNKRDKDSSPKNSPHSERKSKTPSPLTVPPLTIKAEQISPQTKISPLAKTPPRSTEKSPVSALTIEEEQKSQFLKSFSLTPIKAVKNETNEKSPKSPKSPKSISSSVFTHKVVVKSPTSGARDSLKTTISTVFKGSAIPSKRKIKEPVKNVAKKPKLSPPLPAEDFKIKLPPSPIANTAKPNSSPVAKPTTPANEKPLMPPPARINNSTPSTTSYTITTTTPNSKTNQVTSTTSSQAMMRPPIGLPPKKVSGKLSASAAHKMNSIPLPQSMPRIEMAAPGNRTPIAKRYQPILPKSTRPNPFANIPSDVNKLLKDAGTEIKSIASNTKSSGKVYGPKSTTSGTTITADNSLMGPPPAPTTKPQSQSVNQQRHGIAGSANKLGAKNGKTSNSNNYLNLALFNASKSKGNEAPPGCRTPMYTPSSPIYSPSSPQYMPNYNIPTVPTYKYTPRPSGGSGSFLQSILGGANNQMAGLFPAPPTMKDNTNTGTTNGNSSPSHNTNYKPMDIGGGHQQAPKRVYPFARSPSPEDPPEKQLKVKSLLTSCNINIPSSLSITITREDSESQTNNASHPKHKSPVNNYIEILKLPEQSSDALEQSKRASPPAQKLPATPHASSLKLLMPPSTNGNTTSSPVKRDNTEGKSTSYGTTTLSQITQKSQSNPSKSSYNNASSSANKTQATTPNTTAKSPQSNSSPSQMNQKHANDNNQQKSNMKVMEPLKSPQAEQQKSGADKKSPLQSPEKNNASPNGKNTHKSPNSATAVDASKKFRPILPRQNPASSIPEIVPPKVTTGSIIGTYSAPSGVAVKVHAAKKVSPPKKSPGAQQPQPQVAHQQPKNGQSPNALSAAKPNIPQSNKSPAPAHQSSSKLSTNAKSDITPAPMSSPNANTNANKLVHSPHPGIPPAMPSLPSLPTMPNMPPTALQVAAMAASLPGMPSHLGNVSAADFSKLFKDNLLRAQVQAAAAAAQPGGMFYPYANAQQLSHHYSYQQAFMLEQFTRMQRAEALNEFMQKFKSGPGDKPLDNSAGSVGGGKALAVPGPKASPVASTSGSATTKSNAGNTNTTTTVVNSNSNSNGNNSSNGGANVTKAK